MDSMEDNEMFPEQNDTVVESMAEESTVSNEPEFEVIGTVEPQSQPELATIGEEEPVVAAPKSKKKKPVICLMGEFSAGKSTLSNLLIQTEALPVNVTATQLPPVWISKGDDIPYRVALDGGEYDIDLANLEDVSVEDTNHIRIFHDADLLDKIDLIDMLGISDPNMDAEVWQRVIGNADAVIWCSHATQAWRQSEAAVWSMMPPELHEKSFLLLTRMDKILSERDRGRVVKRVARETVGLFYDLFPISLTQALAAKEDAEKWESSGAAGFMEALEELIQEIAGEVTEEHHAEVRDESDIPMRPVLPTRVQPRKLQARPTRQRPAQDGLGDPLSGF